MHCIFHFLLAAEPDHIPHLPFSNGIFLSETEKHIYHAIRQDIRSSSGNHNHLPVYRVCLSFFPYISQIPVFSRFLSFFFHPSLLQSSLLLLFLLRRVLPFSLPKPQPLPLSCAH